MGKAFINGANPAAPKFGMKLNAAMVETNADMLFAPSVCFAQGTKCDVMRDGSCTWRPPQTRKFVVGGSANNWAVFNYSRCVGEKEMS